MAVLVRHHFNRHTADDWEASLDGTFTDVTFTRSGLAGMYLDAYHDGVTAKTVSGLQMSAQTSALFVCWVKPGEGTGFLFGQHNGTNGLGVRQVSTGVVRLMINGTESADVNVLWSTYRYQCFCILYDSGEAQLFVDGTYLATVSATVTWPAVPISFGNYSAGGSALECKLVAFFALDDSNTLNDPYDTAAYWSPFELIKDPDVALPYAGFSPPSTAITTYEDFATDVSGTWFTHNNQSAVAPVMTHNATLKTLDFDNTAQGNSQNHILITSLPQAAVWTWEVTGYIRSDPANRDHWGFGCSILETFPYYRSYYLDRANGIGGTMFINTTTGGTMPTTTEYDDSYNYIAPAVLTWRVIFNNGAVSIYTNNVLRHTYTANESANAQPYFNYYNAAVTLSESKYWSSVQLPSDPPAGPAGALEPFDQVRCHNNSRDMGMGYHILGNSNPARTVQGWTHTRVADKGINPVGYNRQSSYEPDWYRKKTNPNKVSAFSWVREDIGPQYARTVVGADNRMYRLGKIDGNVFDDLSQPISRKVVLLERDGGRIVDQTWSEQGTGYYCFAGLDTARLYTIIAHDYTENFNAVIADNVTPELVLPGNP